MVQVIDAGPFEQQQCGTTGVEGVNVTLYLCMCLS